MAKKFAQVRPDIWIDDDWRNLTKDAQHLYFLLLTDPELSYCGVADWKPNRLLPRAREWTMLELMRAAVELSDAYFLVFDTSTEEVLVRSYMRHDGLLNQPRMAVAVAKAFGTIGSNKIRAAVVWELQRAKREDPDLQGWEKPQMMTVLRQTGVNPREMVTEVELPLGISLDMLLPNRLGVGLAQTQADVSVPPTPSTLHLTPSPATLDKSNALQNEHVYPQGSDSRLSA